MLKSSLTFLIVIHNTYNVSKYFCHWYVENGYKFNENESLDILRNTPRHNKHQDFVPLMIDCYNCVSDLIQLICTYYDVKQNNKKFNPDDMFASAQKEIIEEFMNYCDIEYDEYKKILEKDNMHNKHKRFNIVKKYCNKELKELFTNITFDNLEMWINSINFNEFIIDSFNETTDFKYEDKIDNSIFKWIDYIVEYYHHLSNKMSWGYEHRRDVYLYMKIIENLDKHDYHVCYLDDVQLELFKKFLQIYCEDNNYQLAIDWCDKDNDEAYNIEHSYNYELYDKLDEEFDKETEEINKRKNN